MILGETLTNGLRTLAIAFFACLVCALAPTANLSGVPRFVDGDTPSARLRFALKALMRPKPITFCLKKKMDASYKSRPLKAWLKIKNPKAPAATLVVDRPF